MKLLLGLMRLITHVYYPVNDVVFNFLIESVFFFFFFFFFVISKSCILSISSLIYISSSIIQLITLGALQYNSSNFKCCFFQAIKVVELTSFH